MKTRTAVIIGTTIVGFTLPLIFLLGGDRVEKRWVIDTYQIGEGAWHYTITRAGVFVHSSTQDASSFPAEDAAKAAANLYIETNLAGGDTPLPEKP